MRSSPWPASWASHRDSLLGPAKEQEAAGEWPDSSETNERLDQPSQEPLPAQLALYGHKRHAVVALLDAGLVIDLLVAEVEIAWTVALPFAAESAGKDAGHLEPGMGVLDHLRSSGGLQEEHPGRAWFGQPDRPHGDARRDPPPAAEFISLDEARQVLGRVPAKRPRASHGRRLIDPRQRARQRPFGERRGGRVGDHRAADLLHRAHPVAAGLAGLEMRRDRHPLAEIERTRRIRRQQVFVRVVGNRHCHPSTSPRRRRIASLTRDFTVPRGIWSVRAISLCGRSSKNDISITRNWSEGNVFSALRTRASASAVRNRASASGASSTSYSASTSSTWIAPPRRSRLSESILRLRAMVKIQVAALAFPGS